MSSPMNTPSVPELPLSGYTRSRRLTQAPAKIRPNGAPPIKRWACLPINIPSSPRPKRGKRMTERDGTAVSGLPREGVGTEPPTCSNSNGTEETLFPRPEAHPNVACHEMSQQGAIMDDNDDKEDFKEDEFGFDNNDSEPTSTISNEETEEHKGNSGRRVGRTDPMPPMRQANVNRNWGMYNLSAGSQYDNMVAASTDGSGIGCTPLDPAVPSRTASGVTLLCDGIGHSHSHTSPVTINLYIFLEHRDGVERSHVEYDISVLQISAGEALCSLMGQEGRTACALQKLDPTQQTVLTSTCPLSLKDGASEDLSFREISTLDRVLSEHSLHYSTPLQHCRECPDTTMVLEQTQLSQADLYVLYIHKALSGEGELLELPMAVASTVINSTAPSTMVSKDPAAWVIWDYMFLVSVSSAGSLFNEAYDEPFKIYAAVNILMGIAHEINKSEKKPLTMGRGGRLPQVLSWLKARVGKHQVAIFDQSQKMFERYLTFWNRAQQMSQELSRLEMGGANLDSEQSNMFHMLKVWQEVPARVAEPDAEPLTDDELHYLQ
ncbi:hypothetical protein F5146DRAFT_1146471 [Armillaria mellea]|nr:hypothetical protein F5146DRAFT_1146471 [Armillaria mellea]